jgi:tRNA (adenine22-N1)-methyltransferase
VIDVGTDHARLPVWLVQTGRAQHVWASDLRKGPLQSAAQLVEDTGTGEHIQLRLTDGLEGFSSADGDTVTIAGMGGETMISILAPATWTKKDTLLVLEPQSKQAVLRQWLVEHGYCIVAESLVADAGRIYPILQVQGGPSPAYTPGELHTGRYSQIAQDPLFAEYLSQLIRRCQAAAAYDTKAQALLTEWEQEKERFYS